MYTGAILKRPLDSSFRGYKLRAYRLFVICYVGVIAILLSTFIINFKAQAAQNFILQEYPHVLGGNWFNFKGSENFGLLGIDSPVRRELRDDESHRYSLLLDSNQYLHVSVDQTGIDVAVILFGLDGKKLAEVDSQSIFQDQESLSFITQSPGAYQIEIHPVAGNISFGWYELNVDEVRLAREEDKNSIIADKAFMEGNKLRGEWKAESLLKAIDKYELALSYWQGVKNYQEQVKALKSIGDVHSTTSQYKKAIDYYNRALQLSRTVGNRKLEVDALNSLGYVYVNQGEINRALDYCTNAQALSREIGYDRGEAQALINLGSVSYTSADLQRAISYFNRSLLIYTTIGNNEGQAQALLNRGYSYSDLGNVHEALADYNRALDMYGSVGDLQGKSLALTALGSIYSWIGENQKALDYYNQARQIFSMIGERLGEASTLRGIGYIYESFGEINKALDFYYLALQIYRDIDDSAFEGLTLGSIGRIYNMLGENRKALDFLNKKLVISRSLADPRMEASSLKDTGKVFDSIGMRDKAIEYFNLALSISTKIQDKRGQAYILNNIGYVYYRQNQKQKALGIYQKALRLILEVGDRQGEASILYNIARIERDLGNLTESLSRSEELLRLVEVLRNKVFSSELRASYFGSVRQYYELYIDVLMQLHKKNPAAGFDIIAFEASERARARNLLDMLNEARVDIRQNVEPSLLERERMLQQLLNSKAERQMLLLSRSRTEEERAALNKEISNLISEYDEVRAQIRVRSPRYAALTQPQPLSLHEIQQAVVDEDTTLLEYSLGEERSYLWVVDQKSISSFELPSRAKIEAIARCVHELLTSRNRLIRQSTRQLTKQLTAQADTQYLDEALRLSQTLVGPAASKLGKKRLLVVADGALQFVPFASLPSPESATSQRSNWIPLIVDHELISIPSASTLAMIRKEIDGRKPAQKTVAVFADPVYDGSDPRVKSRTPIPEESSDQQSEAPNTMKSELRGIGEELYLPRLLFSRWEANKILSFVSKGESLAALDFNASLATVKDPKLGQYRIIHFATHGIMNDEHPELSGIVLSLIDENGNRQNGFLQLSEIYNLKLPVELVVLSSCSTGLGKEVRGEGLVGLTRGFMYAGAARVVASLWNVDDRASAEFMKYFYEAMLGAKRLSPSAALRAAQIAMWKQDDWQSPYYWAAFVLQGEWK